MRSGLGLVKAKTINIFPRVCTTLIAAQSTMPNLIHRFCFQAPIVLIAIAKFVPAMLVDVREKFDVLGAGELPPLDTLTTMGYVELIVAALAIFQGNSKLVYIVTSLQYATPLFLVRDFVGLKPMYAYVLLLHAALATVHFSRVMDIPAFLRRALYCAPIAYMGYAKLQSNIWAAVITDMHKLSPIAATTMNPSADSLETMAYIELAIVVLVMINVFPRLFNKVLAGQYMKSIILMGSVDEIKNAGAYYQFLLLFHVAIAVALWSEIPPIPIVDQKANKAEEGKKNK